MKKQIINPDFLIIPFQIISDKELQPTDRLIYGVVYWFERLKDGKCTASNATIARMLGITVGSVQNGLSRLSNQGYIWRTFNDKAKRIRSQIICCIAFDKASLNDDRVSSNNDRKVSSGSEENNKTINNKDISILENQRFSDKDRREIIDLFKIVNPSYKQLFIRKNQGDATRRLLDQYGREMLEKIVKFLPTYNSQPFNGTGIITPIELENKMGKLKAFVDQMRSKQNNKGKVILGL